MRRISHSRSFRRDYRREKRGQYGLHLDEQLDAALQLLANDQVAALDDPSSSWPGMAAASPSSSFSIGLFRR